MCDIEFIKDAPKFGFRELMDKFEDFVKLNIRNNEITNENYVSNETKTRIIDSFCCLYCIAQIRNWVKQNLVLVYDDVVAWHFDGIVVSKSLKLKVSDDGTHYEVTFNDNASNSTATRRAGIGYVGIDNLLLSGNSEQ